MSKIDPSLFSASQSHSEQCPQCGATLSIKHGKSGPFMGCSQYPSCDYIKPLVAQDSHVVKVMEDSECPSCGSELVIKTGRYGMFIGCSSYPDCTYIAQDEQTEEAALPRCPKCSKGHMVKRTNKFGKAFYSCDAYPKCKYSLNAEPLEHTCPACGWQVMVEKRRGNKAVLQCPQKSCQHSIEKGQ